MRQLICAVALTTILSGPFTQVAHSQDDADERFDHITKRIDGLESRVQRTGTTVILFIFGAFCALWAQNTNRSPWLWFFLGWFFHVIAVLVLLAKNADDQRKSRGEPAASGFWVVAAIVFGFILVGATVFWFVMSMR